MPDLQALLELKAVAVILHRHPRTIKRMARGQGAHAAHPLPAVLIGNRLMFEPSKVKRWLARDVRFKPAKPAEGEAEAEVPGAEAAG
jgi:hypothetical protein